MEQKSKHSAIGASSCPRYWECPGSVRLGRQAPEQETSFAAAEGTVAHAVAERALKALKAGKKIDLYSLIGETIMEDDHEIEITEEMIEAVIAFVDVIKLDLKKYGTNTSFLSIEKGFKLQIDPEAYGTLDAALYIPFDTLYVYDFKYGKGILVEVKDNKQLKFYGLGAMAGKDVSRVCTTIVQPRAWHPDGPVRKQVYSIAQMEDFEEQLLEKIVATKHPNAPLIAGAHCKFCKAIFWISDKGIFGCPAIRDEAIIVAQKDFEYQKPKNLIPTAPISELIKFVNMQDRVVDFFKQIKKQLQIRAEKGDAVKGYKLVKAKSNRKWKSEQRVITEFRKTLGDGMFTKPELLSPAKLEKLANGLLAKDALLPYIEKPDTGLTLVKDSDPRSAVKSSASDDFKDIG